ncbi:amino acid adenylation domain-containing protein [Gordonia westfalica]|uniref:Amino acid adenylation domain-containing protein n=1 Tax=Gordonia westfalica TaxID=158898 RepID=A0ABU2GNE7_9ACTN|nr:amino acid adenylation domain-containing protein [Gordonia westfalica]MDS1112981.1 amino acid adenylation domain-containing protein [Gordonia westfalica]
MTATRRALWMSQVLQPDVSHVVAFGLTLRGPLDVPRLVETTRAILEHVGWNDVHIPAGYSPAESSPSDGIAPEPLRRAHSSIDAVVPVDLSRSADPDAESECRAQHFIDAADGADLTMPLFRSELHRLATDRHRWVVRVHHVLTDGAGVLRVMSHVADVYGGLAAAADLPVADPDRLADDENRYADSRRRESDARHWQDVLDGYEPSLLSASSARMTSEITRVTRRLTSPRAAASEELVAALAGLCARLLDTPDVGFALPVAARTSAVRRCAVQPLSNVVPLALNGIGDLPAAEAVRSVASAVIDALRHQLYPREDMLRDRRRAAAFGVVVNLLPAFSPPVVDGLHWCLEVMRTGPVADVAVTMHPADQSGHRAVTWEAPAATFDVEALDTLAARYDTYLTALTREIDDGVTIPDEAVFVEGEWDRFRRRRGPAAPPFIPTARMFAEYCAADPSAVALVDGEIEWSRAELAERVRRGAGQLAAADVRAGDPVAVAVERSAASVVAFWSVLMAGGVWVPLGDPAAPEARTQALLARCGARVGLCGPGVTVEGSIRWLVIDGGGDCAAPTFGGADQWRPPGFDSGPDDTAYLLFTSGSTGHPKGVVMPHRGIPALVAEIRETYALTSRSRLLHVSSPTFDTGIVEMLSAVVTGAALVIAPASTQGGDPLAELIRREGVTHLIMTPSVLDTLPVDLADGLTQVIVGGEALPRRLADMWSARVPLRNAYGPTETRCSINISRPLSPHGEITVGPPMVGVTEAVLDRRGRPQPPGALGTLHCAGTQLADGYLDDPAQTDEAFVDCTISDDPVMYRTGDVATWTDAGDLRILGRRDGQVKLRGLRIELGEIDAALIRCAGVRRCVTTFRELPSGRPGIVSFVVPADMSRPPRRSGIRRELARMLPSYMVPAVVVILDEMPRAATGKLSLASLRDLPLPVNGPSRDAVGPHEALLLEVVGEVLGVESVDPVLGFVEQGGDSLAVVRVARRLAEAGHPEIKPNDVLTAPDLASLAEQMTEPSQQVREGRDEPAGDDDAVERPLTPAERTVMREPDHPLAQLICVAWVPASWARPGAGETSALIGALLERHPALRSVYPDTPTGPVRRTSGDVPVDSVVTRIDVAEVPDRERLRAEAKAMAADLDVRVAPPLAVRLLVGPDGVVMGAVAVLHHIAVDGRSLGVLAHDAETLMTGGALETEHASSGPAHMKTPNADEEGGDLELHNFWKELLVQQSDSAFGWDGVDPASWTNDVAIRRRGLIDADTYGRFRSRAAAENMTPFEAFGDVVATALAKITGQSRVLAATTVSKRPAGAEDVVGNHVLAVITPLSAGDDRETSVTLRRNCIRAATTPMEDVLDLAGRTVDDDRLFPVPVLLGWSPVIAPPSSGGTLYAFPPRRTRWLLQVEGCPASTGELEIGVTGATLALGAERTEQVLAEVSRCLRRW